MARGRVGRYERLILMPLSIILALAVIAYLFQRSWSIAVFVGVMWLVVGAVGQAVNRAKAVSELIEGSTSQERFSAISPEPTPEETMQIGKLCLITFWVVAIVVSVLAHHHGLRWFLAVPAGVSAGFVLILLGGLVSMKPVGRKRS